MYHNAPLLGLGQCCDMLCVQNSGVVEVMERWSPVHVVKASRAHTFPMHSEHKTNFPPTRRTPQNGSGHRDLG